MDKQATIYDVAKRSGVSVATVSRVLGKSDYPVKAQTREKVLAAAQALQYTPSETSKRPKINAGSDLGVIIPNLTNSSYALLLTGIQRIAAQQNYHILLCNSNPDADNDARNIQILMKKHVAGILLASITPDLDTVRDAIKSGFPLITMEQELPLDCIHVGYDYESAGRMMARHLLDMGHRRIGFIGAPMDRPSRVQILQGFRDALQDAGAPIRDEDLMLSEVEAEGESLYEIENGIHFAWRFSQMPRRPTAYACLNDLTALGAMRGFMNRGFKVPEDISIVGFDNIPYCTLGSPPLTTIDQHAARMGEIAARLLIEQIEEPDNAQYTVRLVPELIERESVRNLNILTTL